MRISRLFQDRPVIIVVGLLIITVFVLLVAWQIGLKESDTGRSFDKSSSDEPITTLLVTGDVMLGRYVNARTTQVGDFTWPWQKTADLLRKADMTLINLESPLVADCPITESGMKFCGDTRHTIGLQGAGVDIASVANNHAENYKAEGLRETVGVLSEVGIESVGTGEPVILERNGIRFAFLAYNDVGPRSQQLVAQAREDEIVFAIQQVKNDVDVVVVMYHWGAEYTHNPTTRQRNLAHLSVDAGADLVVGAHPHWIQSMERYEGGVIMYSHGNFIFDQNWSRETSEGIIGKYTFQGPELTGVDFIPVVIERNSQSRLATDEERAVILTSSGLE